MLAFSFPHRLSASPVAARGGDNKHTPVPGADGMEDDGRVTAPSSEVPEPPNPEAKTVVRYKVYKRRWFALLVLCLLNCSNAMVSEPSSERKAGGKLPQQGSDQAGSRVSATVVNWSAVAGINIYILYIWKESANSFVYKTKL